MTVYPLALRLDGRRVLVVGGGAVASRRVPALLDAGADVMVVSPELTPLLQSHLDAGRLTWQARRFTEADVAGAWLVHVAVNDPDAAAEVSAAAERHRVFCVRADDRDAATAWTPAVTRHGRVTVAVLGGGHPRRAVALRDAIAAGLADGSLPSSTPSGSAPSAPSDAVAVPSSAARSGPADPGAADPGAGSARTGHAAAAAAQVGTTPAAGGDPAGAPGRVVLVGAGPGDPELITVKGRRLLARADVVVADRLVPGLLLDELRPDAELVDASKIPYGPSRTQEEINRIIVDRALAGAFVVRLKGGDPYVFGRGGEEVIACAEAGVPVVVVPGVTSSIAAPALAGIPVTHRGVAHEFTVVSGHVAPDNTASLVDWSALARMRGTLVILMGLKNLPAIAATLLHHGRAAGTPAAVVQEGTMGSQRVLRSTLGEVAAATAAAGIRPPAVVVVGEVVAALDPPPVPLAPRLA